MAVFDVQDDTSASTTSLDKIDQPLNILAQIANVPLLKIPLSLGAMLSFFALCLSCVSAGGRVVYAMGRHGLFPAATATAHGTNQTPHIAVTVMAVLAFAIPTIATLDHVTLLDLFNYVGTCAAFGFMVAYALITLAAPAYLKRLGELTTKDWLGCAASLLLLLIPAVGSVYPVPAAPVNIFPYAFLVYLVVGVVWIMAFHRRQPTASSLIRDDLDLSHGRFSTMEPVAGE